MRTVLAPPQALPLRWLGPAYRVTRRRPKAAFAVAAAVSALVVGPAAFGQVPVTLNGPPVQVQPYVSEPGVPMITINPGTPNPFPGGDGSGSGAGPGGVGDGTGGGTGGGSVGSSEPLYTMMGTTWGLTAVSNAQTVGVNPSALAATCVLESGCQNVGGSGTVAGAFQMTASTYTAMINAAIAQNSAIASQIVPGLAGQMDPATESIAASEYLLQGAQTLQSRGVSDPTVLDVRGFFNYGPSGAALAAAADNQTMSEVMPGVSQSTFSANGVTPGETVGQWRANVTVKIGNAATQSVLNT